MTVQDLESFYNLSVAFETQRQQLQQEIKNLREVLEQTSKKLEALEKKDAQ